MFSPSHEAPRHAILTEAERQLQQYFTGHLQKFDLPLEFVGTSFQKQVWAALIAIPYGETRSYGQIAQQIGHPSAVRAVGAANGRNPLPIVAPCHRVIGSNGKLTGFAGGLASKAFYCVWRMDCAGESRRCVVSCLIYRKKSKTATGLSVILFSIKTKIQIYGEICALIIKWVEYEKQQ